MPLLLFVAFIVVPIVELFVIIQVGQVIGAWWTVAILIAVSVMRRMVGQAGGAGCVGAVSRHAGVRAGADDGGHRRGARARRRHAAADPRLSDRHLRVAVDPAADTCAREPCHSLARQRPVRLPRDGPRSESAARLRRAAGRRGGGRRPALRRAAFALRLVESPYSTSPRAPSVVRQAMAAAEGGSEIR